MVKLSGGQQLQRPCAGSSQRRSRKSWRMVGSIPGNPPYARPLVSKANNAKGEGRKLEKKGGYIRAGGVENGADCERLRNTQRRSFQSLKKARRRGRRSTSVTGEWHPSGVPFFFSPFLCISCSLNLYCFVNNKHVCLNYFLGFWDVI